MPKSQTYENNGRGSVANTGIQGLVILVDFEKAVPMIGVSALCESVIIRGIVCKPYKEGIASCHERARRGHRPMSNVPDRRAMGRRCSLFELEKQTTPRRIYIRRKDALICLFTSTDLRNDASAVDAGHPPQTDLARRMDYQGTYFRRCDFEENH